MYKILDVVAELGIFNTHNTSQPLLICMVLKWVQVMNDITLYRQRQRQIEESLMDGQLIDIMLKVRQAPIDLMYKGRSVNLLQFSYQCTH